jgi:uncharacterized membrane protein
MCPIPIAYPHIRLHSDNRMLSSVSIRALPTTEVQYSILRLHRRLPDAESCPHVSDTWLVAGPLVAAQPAQAETWKVCNESAEDVTVSIVYGVLDQRHYVFKGWWRIAGGGRCAVVLSGDNPVKGVFLRGEGASSGNVWGGTNVFCALPRGELSNTNHFDDKSCRTRGGEMKSYKMQVINSSDFTTRLDPPRNSNPSASRRGHPIDDNPRC